MGRRIWEESLPAPALNRQEAVGGYQVLALMEARALVTVALVLVARQPGCRIWRTSSVADVYLTSAEDRVSLCPPFLGMKVGRNLRDRMPPFPDLVGRVVHANYVLGFVPSRLGPWDGVVMWEEGDCFDHPVGPHCQLLAWWDGSRVQF